MPQITNAAQTEAQQGDEKLQKINDQFHWRGPPSALPDLLCPADGQISDEDLAISLNLTRKRINPEMPDLTNDFVTANNLDMRTEIRRERTIEFFDENFRIDDLKRWKTAEDEMPMNLTGVKWKGTDFENRWPDASFKEKDGEGCIIHEKGRNWHEKHYLLPLPTDQLKLNSNLKQNPGWNQ